MRSEKITNNGERANTIFARKMRKLFDESGKTHGNLAEFIQQKTGESVTRQAIGQWCNGNTCPNLKTVPLIAEFFSVSVDYLLTNTEVRTTDIELNAISKFTGLSEESIIALNTSKCTCEQDNFLNNLVSAFIAELYSQNFTFLSLEGIFDIHRPNSNAELEDGEFEKLHDYATKCGYVLLSHDETIEYHSAKMQEIICTAAKIAFKKTFDEAYSLYELNDKSNK